jgi:hypothetical protein
MCPQTEKTFATKHERFLSVSVSIYQSNKRQNGGQQHHKLA